MKAGILHSCILASCIKVVYMCRRGYAYVVYVNIYKYIIIIINIILLYMLQGAYARLQGCKIARFWAVKNNEKV